MGNERTAAPLDAATTLPARSSSPRPPRHDRSDAFLVQSPRDLAEPLRRPQLARPAPAGVQDCVLTEAERSEASLHAGARLGRRGQWELAEPERFDTQRPEKGEVFVDYVRGFRGKRDGLANQDRRGPLSPPWSFKADHAPRPGEPRPSRRLPQSLEVERHVHAFPAELAKRGQGGPHPVGLDRRDRDHAGHERVSLEQDARGGLDEPAHLVSRVMESRQRGEHVDDVADRRGADDEDLHRRSRCSSARVSWSLGSPTMATRPP